MHVLEELQKIPNLVQYIEEGQSCSLRNCPFFKSCPGVDRSILLDSKGREAKHGIFVCDTKALKEIYQNGKGNKIKEKENLDDLRKFYGEIQR